MNSFLPIYDEWLKQEIANVYIQFWTSKRTFNSFVKYLTIWGAWQKNSYQLPVLIFFKSSPHIIPLRIHNKFLKLILYRTHFSFSFQNKTQKTCSNLHRKCAVVEVKSQISLPQNSLCQFSLCNTFQNQDFLSHSSESLLIQCHCYLHRFIVFQFYRGVPRSCTLIKLAQVVSGQ